MDFFCVPGLGHTGQREKGGLILNVQKQAMVAWRGGQWEGKAVGTHLCVTLFLQGKAKIGPGLIQMSSCMGLFPTRSKY